MKTVVLLLGPCSAGKSTTCNALVSDHGWKMYSIDEECEKATNERVQYYEKSLNDAKLFEQLQDYMANEQVLNLCMNGILDITKPGHNQYHFDRFPNPDFPFLEEKLREAGFDPAEIKTLAPILKQVGEIYKTWDYDVLEDRLIENAFNGTAQEEFVVIDMVPLDIEGQSKDTEKFLEKFNQRADAYKAKNGEDSIQSFVIFAYCPPIKLSDRVKQRNINADANMNQSDKRPWQLPLGHLSTMYKAKPGDDQHGRFGSLSHADLMRISYEQSDKKLSGESKAQQFIQEVQEALDANRFANKFARMFGIADHEVSHSMSPNPNLKYDAIIDTSASAPQELAQQVIDVAKPERNTPTPGMKKS